jgi:hypothetical protein
MPKTIWKGILSTAGGRTSDPFEVEIVRTDDGAPHIIRIEGLNRIEMAPAQIRGDAWLPLFADLAEAAGNVVDAFPQNKEERLDEDQANVIVLLGATLATGRAP